MSDFVKIQQDLNSKRQELNASSEKHMKAQAQLLKVEAREKELLRTVDIQNREELLKKVVAEKNKLNESIKRFSDDKKRLSKNIENLIGTFTQLQDPTEQIENLDDSYPFLLFPLRLETRFKKIDNATNQLWVRVYPDDCQINANEKIISESELSNAKLFWIEMWKAGGIEEQERGAWRSIVNSHGVGRAAWIIENYKPVDYPNGKLIKSKKTDVILTVVSQRSFTSAENIAIQDYWKAVWNADGDTLKENQALVVLKTKVGDALSSEIIEKYIPVNFRDPIAASLTKDDVAIQASILQLPTDEEIITKQTSWTQAPKATTMPDRFVAVCYTGENKRTVLFDKAVSDSLAVGPDPSLPENEQMKAVDGNLEINTELKWMVDFEEAIKVGMGMRINLTADEALNGFDKVFVIGLRLSSDQNETKVLLEDLILNHYHSKNGFELLKQGTPTNNTEDEASGYSWLDDADKGYDIVFKAAAEFTEEADFTKKTDGQKLAEYLGISCDTFKKIPNASVTDQQESLAMNTALWPATLGYFMEEMMHPIFSDRDIEATRSFFTHFVSGRGPLPAIRIGKQPYGILPTTVFSKLQFYEKRGLITSHVEANSKTTFLNKLHELISKMDTTWDKLIPSVSHIGKQGDSHQILLDIIGLHANSVEFHQRYAQSIQQLFNQLNLQYEPLFAAELAAGINERGKVILRELKYDLGDQKIPILEKFFLDKPTLLEGDLIDDLPLSEIKEIRKYSKDKKNYIEWLASSDFETIRKQDFGGEEAPTALLFLLLKHALMQAQADVARNLLITNNVVANKKAFHDPEFINVQQKGGGVSKYEFLFSKQPNITGNNDILLKDYIYKPATLQNVIEAKVLKETLDALKVLEKTPTARLERLLTEHLDCCNYRLDAWKTGLINYKLVEQRNLLSGDGLKKDGLYMGAYGWLEEVRPENKVLQNANLSVELKDIFNPQGIPEVQKDNTNLGYIHAPSLNQASTAAILRNAYITNADAGNANPFSINLSSDRVRLAQSFLEGIRNGQSLAALLGYQFERGLHDKYSLGEGEVDMFIYPLRKAFPLVADNLKDTKSDMDPEFQSIEVIDANNVIDGLKLINHIRDSKKPNYPFGLPTAQNPVQLPPADAKQKKAIEEEADRIMNINDALSDLVIAEQVYQVVQGNFERAAGNAEAFSKGSYPPEIEVVNTPRTGATLTQRVAIQFDTSVDSLTSPNSIVDMTARAKAEPSINKWLSSVLPEPKDVLCNIKYSSPNVAEVSITISQKDLKLQSIDLLYLFNLDADQAMSELDDRIMNYVRYNLSNHSNTKLKIDYTSPIDIADKSKVSFFELAALVKSLRKVLIQSKYLSPTDIYLPNEASSNDLIFDDISYLKRVKNSSDDLNSTIVELKLWYHKLNLDELQNSISDTVLLLKLQEFKIEELKSLISASAFTDKEKEELLLMLNKIDITALAVQKNDPVSNLFLKSVIDIDILANLTTNKYLKISLFNIPQSGIGFIYEGIATIYEAILDKIKKVVERWDKKIIEYNSLIAQFDTAGSVEEKFEFLQKAERTISSTSTFPLPVLLAYKNTIDGKKTAFDTKLNELKTLQSSSKEKLTDFFAEVEAAIIKTEDHDIISFDVDDAKNDIEKEKQLANKLIVEIKLSIENLILEIQNRISESNEFITKAIESQTNSEKIAFLQQAAKRILGEEVLLLPHFKLSAKAGDELHNAHAVSETTLEYVKTKEDRIFPVEDWLYSVARVREKIFHWENVAVLAEGFKPSTSIDLKPVQLPYKAAVEPDGSDKDRWLAMKFKDEKDITDKYKIDSDKLLYTACFAADFDKTQFQCGILIDEWTEVIPEKEETTGIAFHYDQPNTEPPQVMLMVVPPVITGEWKWDNIVDSLEETLSMAKKRAIEPSHEPSQIETTGYAQFLPSTMMAVTLYWITVATNLAINNSIYEKID